jgi:hypothetical protein
MAAPESARHPAFPILYIMEEYVRKALLISAPLAALAMAWSGAVQAQEPFKDLDKDHWAYQAVVDLQQKGILIGYPGDYFKGKRTLTRYEFAIAIRRLLDHLPAGTPGPQGDAGAPGPPGPSGSPGPDYGPQIDEIKRLVDEFKNELAAQGVKIGDIEKRLDTLTKDVDAVKNRLDRMVHFTGDFFFGFRGSESREAFVDYGGALGKPNSDLFTNVDAIHDFHLGVNASLAGDVKFKGDIVISNYLAYQGGTLSASGSTAGSQALNTAGMPEVVGLYQADLSVPIASIKSTMDVGRIKQQVTPLTMWRPNWDPYFDLPWYDDGAYVMDGVKLTSKIGSVTSQVWAGAFNSVTDNQGNFMAPLIGSSKGLTGYNPSPFAAPLGGWPSLCTPGVVPASETAGLHVTTTIGHCAEIGATLIDFSANRAAVTSVDTAGGTAPENLVVYGLNFKFAPAGHFMLTGDFAKSVSQDTITQGDGLPNNDNNAYLVIANYGSGGLIGTAGTLYVDPRYAAPGSWAKVGTWYNGTNVDVGFARVDYRKKKLSAYVGADMIEGARDRYAGEGLGIGDRAYDYKGGVAYRINKTWSLTTDYEALLADFCEKTTQNGFATTKPSEQFLTFGAGVNLSGNTVLKVAYQIINLSDQNNMFGSSANANVITTQLAVHF